MHKLAYEHVSEWRHRMKTCRLRQMIGKIKRQSGRRHLLLCEKLHTDTTL